MFKYLKTISDLHLDFDVYDHNYYSRNHWQLPESEFDSETVLIVAGDIWHAAEFVGGRALDFLNSLADRFYHVFFVLGNHDYWGNDLLLLPKALKTDSPNWRKNLTLLEDDHLVLDGVLFVGATLWTDYDRQHPIVMQRARGYMAADHSKISCSDLAWRPNVRPEDFYYKHTQSRKYIFDQLAAHTDVKSKVVVTHMAPCELSVAQKYREAYDSASNFYFFSDMFDDIYDSTANYWIHGHMHNVSDYMINNTRVLCNPRGYAGSEEEENGFDSSMLIAIDSH